MWGWAPGGRGGRYGDMGTPGRAPDRRGNRGMWGQWGAWGQWGMGGGGLWMDVGAMDAMGTLGRAPDGRGENGGQQGATGGNGGQRGAMGGNGASPEVGFGELLHVELLVCERRQVDVADGGEHIACGGGRLGGRQRGGGLGASEGTEWGWGPQREQNGGEGAGRVPEGHRTGGGSQLGWVGRNPPPPLSSPLPPIVGRDAMLWVRALRYGAGLI